MTTLLSEILARLVSILFFVDSYLVFRVLSFPFAFLMAVTRFSAYI
jgi:hypothetical protein